MFSEEQTLDPSQADAVIQTIYNSLDTLKDVSPYIAAVGSVAVGALWARDRLKDSGIGNTLAWRALIRPSSGERSRFRAMRRLALPAIALGMSVATFALSGEEAVRTGQQDALAAVTATFGEGNPDALLVTQGGVDTPMDDSAVPEEIAEEIGGVGIYKFLPKVRFGDQTMDGLMFGLPSLAPGTVQVTGLAGAEEGGEVHINGVPFTVTEELSDDVANMRREVVIASTDVVQEVMHLEDGDDYYGLFVANEEGTDKAVLQDKLDAEYGEGAYTVFTLDEYADGVEKFMGNNGTGLLTLVMAGFILAAAGNEIARSRREIDQNATTTALTRFHGYNRMEAVTPELLKAAYRMAAALPISYLGAKGLTAAVNAIEPGLNAEVTPKNMAAIFVATSVPAVAGAFASARRITKSKKLIEHMGQGN